MIVNININGPVATIFLSSVQPVIIEMPKSHKKIDPPDVVAVKILAVVWKGENCCDESFIDTKLKNIQSIEEMLVLIIPNLISHDTVDTVA